MDFFLVKIIMFAYLLTLVLGRNLNCNPDNAIVAFKQPTYDFSVKFLNRVAQETQYHFVVSPLSTWLQLMSLAEGARGPTQNEIWKVTRHHRVKCFRRKYRKILNSMNEELKFMTNRTNVIIIDKFLNVKGSFIDEVEKTDRTKIISLNFNDPERAAEEANEAINVEMNGNEQAFDENDFNFTVLLMTDSAYFKSDWLIPFNPVHTSTETFYSEEKVPIGTVRLMHQEGSFNLTQVPSINATILELPFNTKNTRFSMLIFLPTNINLYEVFYNLEKISLSSIFNIFKTEGPTVVKVKLPRFKTTSELKNIPELVFDMGVQRMFYPDQSDFRGISDYPMYASMMTQIVDVEITEQGAQASSIPNFIINNPEDIVTFSADRPFAYVIVDKLTENILFGGMYRHPSIF